MSRLDDAALARRPERSGPSVLTRMLSVVVPLLVLIGALLAYATRQAARIHQDLAKLTEEEREAEIAQSLLVELRGAEAWTLREIPAVDRFAIAEDLVQHLDRARTLIEDLHGGDEDADPSDPEHERREAELRGSLVGVVDRMTTLAGGAADWSPFRDDLSAARRQVEVLYRETRNEAMEVAAHLDRSVQRLVDMLFFLALIGAVTFLALAITFRRVVLRPLHLIERATRRLGRPADAEPEPGGAVAVGVHSRDEFGRLARTFEAMAERIDSHRRELEERVEQRTREALRTARLAELGTLAAGIAHEINNPLASIAAGIEGVRRELRGQVPDASLEFLDLALKETARASDIATRLLRLGRQDRGRREAVWLGRKATEVAVMVEHLARQRRVTVRVDVDDALPVLQGDPGEWRQVLFNLLRNAIDATPDGSTVELRAAVEGEQLVLRVRDQGAGFPPDLIDRVFEPFVTTKAPGAGTGLGLAIVDRIVRDWGGRTVARNLEDGAEVVVEVPLSGRVADPGSVRA